MESENTAAVMVSPGQSPQRVCHVSRASCERNIGLLPSIDGILLEQNPGCLQTGRVFVESHERRRHGASAGKAEGR